MTYSVVPNSQVPIRVLHSDEHCLVVYKPPGVVTQPGVDHPDDTVLNAAFAQFGPQLEALGAARDFGLVHRLDRPTSGVLVLGLSPEGYDGVRAQFEARTVQKGYVALVNGAPRPPEGVIRSPLAVVRKSGRKHAIIAPGRRDAREAETRYTTIGAHRGLSLLQCELHTGRLHQIRAHLAHRGCPVVGDREYGRRDGLDKAFRQATGKAIFLHAGQLGFVHPVTRGRLTVRAPLPATHLEFLDARGVPCPRRWRR